MCTDNPDMPKEANKAKCFVVACFVFSVFSMIGFFSGTWGTIGAICGILACIASSMLMCCAPKTVDRGSCKFTAASVLLLLAGIIQLIMGIIVIYVLMGTLNEVNEGSHCADRYSTCATDSSGASCKGGVCFKNDPHDIVVLDGIYSTFKTGGSPNDAIDRALFKMRDETHVEQYRNGTQSNEFDFHDGVLSGCDGCDGVTGTVQANGDIVWTHGYTSRKQSSAATNSCKAQSDWDTCKDLHDGVKAAVSGIATFVFGISAAFLFTAGSLNTAGGVYCHKAKVAINLGGHPARFYTTGDTLPALAEPK